MDNMTTIRLVDAGTGRTVGSATVSPPFPDAHLTDAALAVMSDDPGLDGYALVAVSHDLGIGYVAEVMRER